MKSVPPPFKGLRSESGVVIVLIQSGEELGRIDLADKPVLFGRNDDCDVSIPDPSVSGYHARLRLLQGTVIVEGVNATTGVAVNGKPVNVPTPLKSGDLLRLGNWEVEIRIENPVRSVQKPVPVSGKDGNLSDSGTLQPAFTLKRLVPLAVCCLLLGWVARAFIPGRDFVNLSLIPVLMLALPSVTLAVFSICYFIRPKVFPGRQAISALCFSMVAGIAVVTGWNKIVAFTQEAGSGNVLILEMVMGIVALANEAMQSESIIERFIGFTAGFGMWAEMVKLLPLFYLVVRTGKSGRALDYRGFLAVGFFSGLGFGIVEALIDYAPWGWTPDARGNITRWFSDVPAHASCTLIGAAVIWLAAPMIIRAGSVYRRIGLCAAVTCVMAVVRAAYIVLYGLPLMGLAMTGLLLIVTWWTVKTVDQKASETTPATLGEEGDVLGVMGWVNSYETGRRSLRRLYITAGAMIIASMLFSSASERAQQPFRQRTLNELLDQALVDEFKSLVNTDRGRQLDEEHRRREGRIMTEGISAWPQEQSDRFAKRNAEAQQAQAESDRRKVSQQVQDLSDSRKRMLRSETDFLRNEVRTMRNDRPRYPADSTKYDQQLRAKEGLLKGKESELYGQ